MTRREVTSVTSNDPFATRQDEAHQVLLDHVANGVLMIHALRAAAQVGVADLLAEGAMSVEELARRSGSHPSALCRLLRFLASGGVFVEAEPGVFAQNHVSHCLRTEVSGSLRAFVDVEHLDYGNLEAYRELTYSVRTGKPSFTHAHGVPIWEYFAQHPVAADSFQRIVMALNGAYSDVQTGGFDFSGMRAVADIGGGLGGLIGAILRAHPHLAGILFDVPHVAESARAALASSDLASRCEVVGGDFFEAVPAADVYVLRHILHDWDDESCVKILRNCRRASPRAPVLIVERVLSNDSHAHFTLMLDLHMLMFFSNAKERNRAEYAALLDAAGYRLREVLPTGSPLSIVEGVPRGA
jgi:hypothetical protein